VSDPTPASEQLVPAAIPAPTRVPGEPAWRTVLVVMVTLVASAVASMAALFVAVRSSSDATTGADFSERMDAWMAHHLTTVPGMLVLLLPGQLTMFAMVAFFSGADEQGLLQRLGFVRPRASPKAIVLSVIGTLGVQWLVSVAFDWTGVEPNEQMKHIWRMVATPTGVSAACVALLISGTPALCEEAVFRGFAQRRLLQRWSPALAIAVASVLFALAHMNVQQSPAVLPIGLWLGFVAWRTGSVWVSALCHFANNMSAFVFGRMWGDPDSGALPSSAPFLVAGVVLLACTWLAARTLNREAASA
jgi:membrane protease YdiL (CAAX protease family)